MFNNERFTNSIIVLRKKEKIKQTEMAIYADVNESTYNKFEKGKRRPSAQAVVNMVNYFGVSIADCCGEESELEKSYETKRLALLLDQVTDKSDINTLYHALLAMKKVKQNDTV